MTDPARYRIRVIIHEGGAKNELIFNRQVYAADRREIAALLEAAAEDAYNLIPVRQVNLEAAQARIDQLEREVNELHNRLGNTVRNLPDDGLTDEQRRLLAGGYPPGTPNAGTPKFPGAGTRENPFRVPPPFFGRFGRPTYGPADGAP